MAYYRLDQLVDMLAVFSPTDQNYLDKMRKLINVDVLIIDDFMTISINQRGQEDLTKIIFDRDGRLPTLISSQSAAAYWVETLPDSVGADSLVSRLNNGHRLRIGDFAMRKATAPPNRTGQIKQTAGPTKSARPQYQLPRTRQYRVPRTPVPKTRI